MCKEPERKNARVFVDGQNLYHQAKEAFNYYYPNYDILKLSFFVCQKYNFSLCGANFYTGIPNGKVDSLWADFWNKKLSRMSRGVKTFSRELKYAPQTICERDQHGDFVEKEVLVGREKGIDIRIAIDMLKTCRNRSCDVAIIFSQDQDLNEAVKEARAISRTAGRWFKIISAFPISESSKNQRGIDETDWCMISKEEYDSCIDNYNYF